MTAEKFMARFAELAHAIQTGVAYDHAAGSKDGTPKHLRTGINLALVQHAAIVKLLIAAGVCTEQQYHEACIAELEAEVARYEARLAKRYGKTIRLG